MNVSGGVVRILPIPPVQVGRHNQIAKLLLDTCRSSLELAGQRTQLKRQVRWARSHFHGSFCEATPNDTPMREAEPVENPKP